MKPRTFILTERECAELLSAYSHPSDALSKTRYQAVRLYGLGYAMELITDVCVCSPRSLLRWCQSYREGGLSTLCDHRQGGNRSRLQSEQIQTLTHQLHTYTPAQLLGKEACVREGAFWSVPDLTCLLKRDYGITYQQSSSYCRLLHRCGLSYQRPAKQYKSRSAVKVMDFEEQLEKK
jgi:transposase